MGTLASELGHLAPDAAAPRVYADANLPAGIVSMMRHELGWDVLFVVEDERLRRLRQHEHVRCANRQPGLDDPVRLAVGGEDERDAQLAGVRQLAVDGRGLEHVERHVRGRLRLGEPRGPDQRDRRLVREHRGDAVGRRAAQQHAQALDPVVAVTVHLRSLRSRRRSAPSCRCCSGGRE